MLSLKSSSSSTEGTGGGGSGIGGPGEWWNRFSKDGLMTGDGRVILDALSKAVQVFPVDEYRSDPLLLRIWLAFLEAS